jgi:hypothetical protein
MRLSEVKTRSDIRIYKASDITNGVRKIHSGDETVLERRCQNADNETSHMPLTVYHQPNESVC